MGNTFSSGELAKSCNISIRTVQYYDREGLLKPSGFGNGGRRIYTEDDLKKLSVICLYKSLGFSLNDIKGVMGGDNPYDNLNSVILSRQEKIDTEIRSLLQIKERLDACRAQINDTGKIKVESIHELDGLLSRKKRHRKTDVMTCIFLACYILLLAIGFPASISLGGFAPVAMIAVAIALLFGLIYYHSAVNSYICPSCHEKFSISFWKDMVSPNGIKKGKYLKCPNCSRRGWFTETFPD